MLNVRVKFLDMFKDSFKNNHFKHYEHSMYLICETLINQLNMMFKHVMSYEAMFIMVWQSTKISRRLILKENEICQNSLLISIQGHFVSIHIVQYRYRVQCIDTCWIFVHCINIGFKVSIHTLSFLKNS